MRLDYLTFQIDDSFDTTGQLLQVMAYRDLPLPSFMLGGVQMGAVLQSLLTSIPYCTSVNTPSGQKQLTEDDRVVKGFVALH